MIIKGNKAGSVGFWSSHLLRDDTNEVARVVEIKGLAADTLPAALREMAALAAGSRSQGNFLYQANINPQADERLTPTQWIEAVDALEKNLGFDGHQRVVVEHVKEGRQHYHIVWNRVDADTLKVADITGNYAKHEKTARDLESRFDLTPTPTPQANRERAPELWEKRAAERSGIDPQQVKADATAAWRQTSTGAAFVAAIESRGYIVAQGDRRDFCLVDHAGTAHSLTRRIEGAKAADVRARMGDIDRTSLPTVAEARASQRQNATIERGSTAPQTAQDPAPEISKGSATNTAAKPPLMVANALTGALTTLAAFADFLCGLTDAPQQPKRGHSVDGTLNNAKGEQSANAYATRLSGGRLRALRPAEAAARSQRKSPEKAICSQPTGDVWASR